MIRRIVAVLLLLGLIIGLCAMVAARHETGTLTWGYSTATTVTRDTLVQATGDTSAPFDLIYRPNRENGAQPGQANFMIHVRQISDSTNVTYFLDGSIDKTYWAILEQISIEQSDVAADVDTILAVVGDSTKGMTYGRIRTVPAMAAGDSLSTTVQKSLVW